MRKSIKTPSTFAAIGVALVLSSFSGTSLAAFFQLFENSVSQMGSAHAGGAAYANDASTVWYNPAGMTRLERAQFSVGGHIVIPSTEFSDQGSTITPLVGGAALTGSNGGDAGNTALVPHLYYTRPINDKLTFGVGVNAPFGLKTEYDDGWKGRYHALESEIKTINVNPSIAYRLNDSFSIGGGISIQHTEATLTNAIDFGTICLVAQGAGTLPAGTCAALGQSSQGNDGRANLEADNTEVGFNVGFLWSAGNDRTRVGAHYRSDMDHGLEGTSDISTPDAGTATLAGLIGQVDSAVTADVTFPATVSVSAYHELNAAWAIMGDITQTRWSDLPELRVKFASGASDSVITLGLENVERFAVGASFKPNERWTYRFGVALDESPTPSAALRTPRLPDEDRIWYTFGASFRKSDTTSFDFAFAFIDIDDAAISKSTTDTENLFRGNLLGQYSADVTIISAQYNHRFKTR